MSESISDPDIQKIYNLEARMRTGVRQLPFLPIKRVLPIPLFEPKDENIKIQINTPDNINSNSIDLKTIQKLPFESEKNNNEIQNEKEKDKEKNSDEKKKKKTIDIKIKNPIETNKAIFSDNSNEGTNLINNSKITDFFGKKNAKNNIENIISFKNIDKKIKKEETIINNFVLNNYLGAEKTVSNSHSENESNQIQENLKLKEEVRKLNRKIVEKESCIEEKQNKIFELTEENKLIHLEFKKIDENQNIYSKQTKTIICKLLLQTQKLKREQNRNVLFAQRQRLGEFANQRQGHKFIEIWIDGLEIKMVKDKIDKIRAEKEILEKKKKNIKFKKNQNQTSKCASFSDSENMNSTSISEYDCTELKNRISFQLNILQKEEATLLEELKKLDQEKIIFIYNLKKQIEEDNSRFSKPGIDNPLPAWPCLLQRYQLLNLLGKGGFSEVYKGFDLEKMIDVACKIHQLHNSWTESFKSEYIKHALRETSTHSKFSHPNIVKLYETFEIDSNSLCTILEYCDGPDLSLYMKQNKNMTEKEIKSIIRQILFGIKYLHESPTKVIHYDLKPQNIMFHHGQLKISDFGLCKIIEENATKLELTSQGFGTYWYLPPECFENSNPYSPTLITTKVDIWSVGVICYEMIFGEKPFGNNMSSEKIMAEKIILGADGVKFPNKPSITVECKEFLLGCLNRETSKRWDANKALQSAFLKTK